MGFLVKKASATISGGGTVPRSDIEKKQLIKAG
jgi:hypothetical protein